MPTGYTAKLENRNFDIKTWLKEDVIRNFGVTCMFRDHGDMTEEEVMSALEASAKKEGYHTKRLKISKERLASFALKSPDTLAVVYELERLNAETDYKKTLEDFHQKKASHQKAIARVNEIRFKTDPNAAPNSPAALIANAVEFAASQLESAFQFDFSTEPLKPAILEQNLDEWRSSKITMHAQDVGYHEKNLSKDNVMNDSSLESYRAYVKFINENV
jgi:hypothetical protein